MGLLFYISPKYRYFGVFYLIEVRLKCISFIPLFVFPQNIDQIFICYRACRTAVMIGTAMNKSQMKTILQQMSKMDQPWNCPHGRPTLRHLVNLQLLKSI